MASRLELLLGDTPAPPSARGRRWLSAILVEALVGIEGHPWAEDGARAPSR